MRTNPIDFKRVTNLYNAQVRDITEKVRAWLPGWVKWHIQVERATHETVGNLVGSKSSFKLPRQWKKARPYFDQIAWLAVKSAWWLDAYKTYGIQNELPDCFRQLVLLIPGDDEQHRTHTACHLVADVRGGGMEHQKVPEQVWGITKNLKKEQE